MGLIIALIIVAAGATGSAVKNKVFDKGYDNTYRSTLAFERNALEENLAVAQAKQERTVVELGKDDAAASVSMARTQDKVRRLEARIAKIEARQAKAAQPVTE